MHNHHSHMSHDPGVWNMWDPWLFLFLAAVGALYLWLVGNGRSQFAEAEPVKGRRKALFIGGLVLWFAMSGTPLHHYGHHYLFSLHMLEQSVLYLMVPPMLLLGLPAWLLRPLLKRRFWKGLLTFASRPLISVFVFNMLFSLYHMPLIFDTARAYPLLDSAYHVLLMLTAFQMWWPMVAPLPELDRMSYLRKLGYIFANGVLLTPACALIIFAQTPMYESYATAPQLFELLSRQDDQQLGGVIMKLMQEFIYGSILLSLLVKWYKSENSDEQPNPLAQQPAWASDAANRQPNRA